MNNSVMAMRVMAQCLTVAMAIAQWQWHSGGNEGDHEGDHPPYPEGSNALKKKMVFRKDLM